MSTDDRPEPLILVIFGASGDLAKRKLLPAIFDLYARNYLPENFAVLGVSRSKLTDDDFRNQVFLDSQFIDLSSVDPTVKENFRQCLHYEAIDTNNAADYALVKQRMDALAKEHQTGSNAIFYLSTPPILYEKIPAFLAEHGLNCCPTNAAASDPEDCQQQGYRRLVVEKPFGSDLNSARQLNQALKNYFPENEIYRIDHYLGKETVQNLLVTRFANGVFEPLWNRNYIHHVEITNAEQIGVGSRGGYYDQSGALRDMLQNHLMQVVAHVAMEPPIAPNADSIRKEKIKLFESLRPIPEHQIKTCAIRGQYTSSIVRGEQVKGYREEEGVPEDSKTETYAAVRFFIDNWRWSGVPFIARTGKRLPTKVTEVTITFKKPPHTLFRRRQDVFENGYNQLVIRIQPDEGLLLNFGMKIPGQGFHVKNVGMDFHYSDLTQDDVPEAYERLLLDCMKGDATLYAHGDSVESTWEFVEPILDAWHNDPDIPVYGYPAGTWGPEVADRLIEPDDLCWRNPCRRLTDDNSFCEL